jgi:hypothetical protein
MPVRGPAAAILFFACPKKSIQKKRHPDAAFFLRSLLLARVFGRAVLALRKRAASLPLPCRANLAKSSGARRGITGENPAHRKT